MAIFRRTRTSVTDPYANVADGVIAASVRTGETSFFSRGKEDLGIKRALADVMGQLGNQAWRRGEQRPDKLQPVVKKYPDGAIVVQVVGPNQQTFYSPVRAPSGWQHPDHLPGYQPAFRGVALGGVIGGPDFEFGGSGLKPEYEAFVNKCRSLPGINGRNIPNPTLIQGDNGQLYMVDNPGSPNVRHAVSMTGNEKEAFRGFANVASAVGANANIQAVSNSQKILGNTLGQIGRLESKKTSYGIAAGAAVSGVLIGKSGIKDFKQDETGRSHKVRGTLKLLGAVLLEGGAIVAGQHGAKIGTAEQSWAQNMQSKINQPSSGRTTP